MRFTFSALFALILAAPVAAQEDGLAGYWKFNVFVEGTHNTFWLFHLDKDKDGKLTASAEVLKGAPRVELDNVKVDGDSIKMKVTLLTPQGKIPFDYEARLPKPGAKKIFGSMTQGGSMIPVIMEATSAKSIFELDRETLLKTPTDPRSFGAIIDVIDRAKDNKVDAKDLQTWVDGSLKTAEIYGPKLQISHHIRLLNALQRQQKAYAAVAVETARKVTKQLDTKLPLDTQAQIATLAAKLLREGGEAKEADAVDSRIDGLEATAYADYAKASAAAIKTEKFAGRKNKSKRAVLVELFTGAMCPPCVAADMAFDGLERTYGPGEVVLLQYHMHVPAPEPMSNADSDARFDLYADAYPKKVTGTPAIVFNGKLEAPGGGSREEAPDKYKEYTAVVNKMLETPHAIQLTASAVRTGEKISVSAKVAGLDKPGEKVRLRLALVEDWVRFKGGNGLQYHHRVVRALPGGAKGISVKAKDFEHKAAVDLDELRAALNKYLNDDYPEGARPMRLRNLSVVAFVQDDATNEVLQAVNVPVVNTK